MLEAQQTCEPMGVTDMSETVAAWRGSVLGLGPEEAPDPVQGVREGFLWEQPEVRSKG